MYPADFTEGGSVNQKWFKWSTTNDLAAKKYMKDGQYLVRCVVCQDEQFNDSAVWVCTKPKCLKASAIVHELLGNTLIQDEEGSWFSEEENNTAPSKNSMKWWDKKDEPDQPGG